MKKSNLRRGVTLLEIVVVLVIVATGAALAVPKLQKGAAQRRADSAIETLRSISHCVRMYKMERGVAPAKLSDMVGAAWNWCLDPKVFDKNYTWPDLNAPLGDYLDAVNTKDNRTVCIKPLGAATVWEWKGTPQPIDTQGYIYDFLSSARSCSNATITGYFRKIKE